MLLTDESVLIVIVLNLSKITAPLPTVISAVELIFTFTSASVLATAPAPVDFATVLILSAKPVLTMMFISPKSALILAPAFTVILAFLLSVLYALMPWTSKNPPPTAIVLAVIVASESIVASTPAPASRAPSIIIFDTVLMKLDPYVSVASTANPILAELATLVAV